MSFAKQRWATLVVLAATVGAGCSLALFDEPPDAGDADTTETDGDADVPLGCGNGTEDPGEECDDGNRTDGDGCDNDCRWTCATDAQCRDTDLCNGAEMCETASHVCIPGENAPNGTDCELPDGSDGQCRSGRCRPLTCGNGTVDADQGEECDDANDDDSDRCPSLCLWATCGDGFVWSTEGGDEVCDDGNFMDGDGCDSDCTWSCSEPVECDDEEPCNGVERCEDHVCVMGTPPSEGADCTTADGQSGTCQAGICTPPPVCGDGTWMPPEEECDDGNTFPDDGCEPDCRTTCSSEENCHESPDNVCTTDSCVLLDETTGARTCSHVNNTNDCDDGRDCTENDRCAGGTCAGTTIDGDHDGFGMAPCGDDCNDGDAAVHPTAADACNGIDDDCDTSTDEDFVSGAPCDGDDEDLCADGAYECLGGVRTCSDDAASQVEVCNDVDDDCDGVTEEGLFCRVDGGLTTNSLLAIYGSRWDNIWAVGVGGQILHRDRTGWVVARPYASGEPTLTDVWCGAVGSQMWAVGEDSTILHYEGLGPGYTFNAMTLGSGAADFEAVFGIPGTGSASVSVGAYQPIATRAAWYRAPSPMSTSWREQMLPVGPNRLYDIWGPAGIDLVAVGADGKAVHWNGTTYAEETVSTGGQHLYAVWGSSASDIWAVGSGGGIWHRTGDSAWVAVTGLTTYDIIDISGSSAGNIWAVTNHGGELLHYNGTTWAVVPITGVPLVGTTAIWVLDEHHLWFTAQDGGIYRHGY